MSKQQKPPDDHQKNVQARQQDWQHLKERLEDHLHSFPSSGDSDAWVRWEYSPEEWALFDRLDWKPGRRVVFWVSISLLFLPGLGFFFYALGGPVVAVTTVVIVALGLLFFFWLGSNGEAGRRHRARKKSAQPHRITISKQGIWEAGTYFPLTRLRTVKMTSPPPVLHFHSTIGSVSTYDADVDPVYRLRVLVPRGHEEEAERLVQRFRIEVIEAQEQALERWRNPPEPG